MANPKQNHENDNKLDNSSEERSLGEAFADRLEELLGLEANFILDHDEEYTEENGWRIDRYNTELPSEPPGEPVPNGSWELAKEVLYRYEFPDPNLITGFYRDNVPLKDRRMLLRAKFLFFVFELGVRINKVIDETIANVDDRGPARIWGYSYYTLEGHFEMGEITFSVLKFLDSGKVEFRIHAYSQTGTIRNIFYRIGFAIFGRRLQVRFSRQALKRMQMLVNMRLEQSAATPSK